MNIALLKFKRKDTWIVTVPGRYGKGFHSCCQSKCKSYHKIRCPVFPHLFVKYCYCGKTFEARIVQKYCSPHCKVQMDWRRRKDRPYYKLQAIKRRKRWERKHHKERIKGPRSKGWKGHS